MGKANSKLHPDIIAELQKTTYFDKKEIQQCYKTFIRDCPSGTLSKTDFIAIYQQFFPFGNSTAFAEYVFRMFDVNKNGTIEFDEYLAILSITSRGKLEEKIKWAFRFYDLDEDGAIGRDEMLAVLEAVYLMMGTMVRLAEDEDTPAKRLDKIFGQIDQDCNGKITYDEFREQAHVDPTIIHGLLLYDGLV